MSKIKVLQSKSVFTYKEHQVQVLNEYNSCLGGRTRWFFSVEDLEKFLPIQPENYLIIVSHDNFVGIELTDLLAIATEKEDNDHEADEILSFVNAALTKGYTTKALARLYHACRIYQAWINSLGDKE